MANQSSPMLLGRMSYAATLGLEIGGTARTTPFCFSGLVQGAAGEIWRVGSVRQRNSRRAFHVAHTALAALALELTLILKRCKLVEVEEAERDSALQTAVPLAPEEENSLAKD